MTFPPVIKECVKSVSSAAHLMPPLCLGNNLIHTGTRTLSLATPSLPGSPAVQSYIWVTSSHVQSFCIPTSGPTT